MRLQASRQHSCKQPRRKKYQRHRKPARPKLKKMSTAACGAACRAAGFRLRRRRVEGKRVSSVLTTQCQLATGDGPVIAANAVLSVNAAAAESRLRSCTAWIGRGLETSSMKAVLALQFRPPEQPQTTANVKSIIASLWPAECVAESTCATTAYVSLT